ncbi:MAG: PcfJ domain-containing protein [Gammaproteobacteria bacterium]|nr:PcfJ domain-containing protein [Gammaproteobacteria bacterium]
MTKKKKKPIVKSNQIHNQLATHIGNLKLANSQDYVQWCRDNHFSTSLVKSKRNFATEFEYYKKFEAEKSLKQNKVNSNLKQIITKIYHNNIQLECLNTEILQTIYQGFRYVQEKTQLHKTLLFLDSKTDLLKDPHYIKGVITLTKYSNNWIRPLEQWKPNTHNTDRQFSSLARYLLAQYDVPAFMDKVWFEKNISDSKRNIAHRENWFIHIGSGKNIHNLKGLPVPLTKKMAHHFLNAPEKFTIDAAIRWGQIHALGGNERLSQAISETKVVNYFNDNDFWLSVFRFFIQNPMLDIVHISPIIDYIWEQKYEDRQIFVERGVIETQGPEQPHFSMNKRTPETLLDQVEQWHIKLGKETRHGLLQWTKSNINEFQYIEGSSANRNMKIWKIRELLSSQELIHEGRKLSHCVASYANSCHKGKSSIWTMEREDESGIEKLLTIEVNTSTKRILQVRGKRNRFANKIEEKIINRWRLTEGLVD